MVMFKEILCNSLMYFINTDTCPHVSCASCCVLHFISDKFGLKQYSTGYMMNFPKFLECLNNFCLSGNIQTGLPGKFLWQGRAVLESRCNCLESSKVMESHAKSVRVGLDVGFKI